MSTAQTIKKIRTTLCYEQRELGELIGVSTQCISNWENGLREPRTRHKRKLLEIAKEHKIKVKVEDFS